MFSILFSLSLFEWLFLFTGLIIIFSVGHAVDDILSHTDVHGKLFIGFFALLVFLWLFHQSTYAMDNHEIVSAINTYRVENNLNPLEYDSDLQTASDLRANEAVSVWSHTRPDGTRFYTANADIYGENLAQYEGDSRNSSADILLNAWKNSEAHNRELLRPQYDTVCIGFSECGSVVSCEFGIYPEHAKQLGY